MIDFSSVSKCLQTSILPIVNKIQKQERINNNVNSSILYRKSYPQFTEYTTLVHCFCECQELLFRWLLASNNSLHQFETHQRSW